MILWNSLSFHWRKLFGQRVQKIPLDAGSTCPNRDGTLSREGCSFCNASGSGSGLGLAGMDIAAQWEYWRMHFKASAGTELFVAYLQSFSNTYGPACRLRELMKAIRLLPGLAGISVGTRPDCVDEEKAGILAEMPCAENWLELGVQSFNDDTLRRVNRGHDAAASIRAIHIAAKAGLSVCAHLMVGLPGERPEATLDAVRLLNTLPVRGVKFHNVYVCKNTPLARTFLEGRFQTMSRESYVELVVKALCLLRPDIIVHRVVADPTAGELLAPDWTLTKHQTIMDIERRMRAIRKAEEAPQNPRLEQ